MVPCVMAALLASLSARSLSLPPHVQDRTCTGVSQGQLASKRERGGEGGRERGGGREEEREREGEKKKRVIVSIVSNCRTLKSLAYVCHPLAHVKEPMVVCVGGGGS